MTTLHVTEIPSARRKLYDEQHATNLAFAHGAAFAGAYRRRCAEIRELDRAADAARATGGAA